MGSEPSTSIWSGRPCWRMDVSLVRYQRSQPTDQFTSQVPSSSAELLPPSFDSQRAVSDFIKMKQALQTALLLAAGWSLHWRVADARRAFVALIPNGNGPMGHANGVDGGPLNAFGEAFNVANQQWTPALCQQDSDGDGATNGEELGDPCCRWTPGGALAATAMVTHPGEADAFTAAQLAGMKCAEAQDVPADDGRSLEPAVGSAGSASGSADADVSWPDVGPTTRSRRSAPAPTPADTVPPAKSAATSRFPSVIAALIAFVVAAMSSQVLA